MKEDYTQVLRYIKENLAGVEVSRIVMDFEYGEWGAFYSVFPGVSIT